MTWKFFRLTAGDSIPSRQRIALFNAAQAIRSNSYRLRRPSRIDIDYLQGYLTPSRLLLSLRGQSYSERNR